MNTTKTSVIEVVTLTVKDGVTMSEFALLDKAVEREHVSHQPGFVSRESAAGDDGEWLVIVRWRSVEDADASMSTFMDAPAAAEFVASIDASSMVMKRYTKLDWLEPSCQT